jgi:hypothetical protein
MNTKQKEENEERQPTFFEQIKAAYLAGLNPFSVQPPQKTPQVGGDTRPMVYADHDPHCRWRD